MRENYFRKCILLLLPLACINAFAQQDINDVGAARVTQMKVQGLLTGQEQYTNRNATAISNPTMQMAPQSANPTPNVSTQCNCWVQRDASWSVAQFDGTGASGGPGVPPDYRNDDWSTLALTLPFNFCFYGTQVTDVYINNNGNVSINAPYSTFTASSFPSSNYTMIAPFWGDVDTQNPASGIVYYKIMPTYMIVQWDQVGYFNQQSDKLNTFQLIMSDGMDPIIGFNTNVAFCYGDMQWTTGSASGGTNGFGGTPATVGVNQGNGIDYIQFGMFDDSTSIYDGPYGNNDGVSWLDNQSFKINACISSANIPPVLNSLNACDTIVICENSTYTLTANYLAPEQGQTTHINTAFFGMQPYINILSNDTGNTAQIVLEISGTSANLGFHTINLTALDNGTPSPAGTSSNFVIEVIPAAAPTFTFSPANPIQTNSAVTFTNTTPVVAGAVYSWDFGDGTPPSASTNALHTYTTSGTYNVVLTVTYPNGCIVTSTQQVIITSCTPASFTVTNVCLGNPVTITYTSVAGPGAIFTWDFDSATVLSGSGQGPFTITWPSSGTYTVTLDVTEPTCSSSSSMPVIVNGVPTAAISPLISICEGDQATISFNGTASATATYNWVFGSGTIISGSGSGPYSVQYSTAGTETISLLVDDNGCVDSTTTSLVINPIPNSLFTVPVVACANDVLNVAYTGTSGAGATYTWDFNGANVNSGSGQGPYDISWSVGGSYDVTLTVTENGCVSPLTTMPVVVTDIPVVSISPLTAICVGGTTNAVFNGTAGAGATYTWGFGNGAVISGSGAGPYSLTWNTPGQDSVTLTVTEFGCSASSQTLVTINPIPTSLFSINNAACVNQPVGIGYTGSATPAATYTWTFGSASVISGSGAGPYSLSWNAQGSYQISLVVTENGCVSPQTDLFATVNPIPAVMAGLDQTSCSGVSVPLGDSAVVGSVYQWSPVQSLSDATISNPTATISNNGNADASAMYILTVTDVNGCMNSDSVMVMTHPVPVIGFPKPPGQCLDGNNFTLAAFSNISSSMNYSWAFAGPATASGMTQQTANVTYSNIGTYAVQLTGDYSGCPATPYSDSVSIYEMPVPDFSPVIDNGCRPLTVPFANLTPGTNNSYYWVFGDGNSDVGTTPMHTYNAAGVYSVKLNATTNHGCSSDTTYTSLINVFADASADFIPNPPVANILAPTIQFQNNSANVLTYQWDFGDSTAFNTTDWSPDHTYTLIGTYNVMLSVMSPDGCMDTIRGTVSVEDIFSFYIPNAFSPNGDGVNDYFRGWGVAINSYNMRIYNRWGELIFKTSDYDQAWDGKLKSGPILADTYVYKIELVDLHGEKHTYVGDVSVVY